MHELGLFHGDVAPRNVVKQDGRPVIIDFARSGFHECDGSCKELLETKKQLGLDPVRQDVTKHFGGASLLMVAAVSCFIFLWLWTAGIAGLVESAFIRCK